MNNPVQLDMFLEEGGKRHYSTLVTAVSYEKRGYTSLLKILEKFSIDKIYLISFGTEDLDDRSKFKWTNQLDRIMLLLDQKEIDYRIIEGSRLSAHTIFHVEKDHKFLFPAIINITTFPKNWIIQLAKIFDDKNNIFFYQRSGYRKPTTDELTIGVKQIIPIEGFEGIRNLRSEDLLILLLGFEGNRALAFLSVFSPYRILPVIGVPGVEKFDSLFIDSVENCNKALLRRHSVIKNETGGFTTVSSLNHISLFTELENLITRYKKEDLDISVSPLGTKPQALGLYLLWKKYPYIQIIYSLPTIRLNITENGENKLDLEAVNSSNEEKEEFWIYLL